MPGARTIVISTPSATDRYGDPTGTPTQVTVDGCLLAPLPSTETDTQLQDNTGDGYTVYAPAGTAVNASQSVVVDGVVFRVAGEPRPWAEAGIEFNILRQR